MDEIRFLIRLYGAANFIGGLMVGGGAVYLFLTFR